MHANSKGSEQRKDGQGGQRGLLDWSQSSLDHSLSTIEHVVASSSSQLNDDFNGMELEMRDLAHWLEEDISLQQDPWQSAASSGAVSMSPISTEFDNAVLRIGNASEAVLSGFDDDFTVFVSAPTVVPVGDSGYSTPEKSPQNRSASLLPSHAGDLYRSLGSVSEFGGSEDEKQVEDTDDIGLPTEEEIRATSSRIFGTDVLAQNPTLQSREPTVRPALPPEPQSLSMPEPTTNIDPTSSLLNVGTSGDGDESYDMAPFDLSRVLSALQEMKAEIATMEDEGERRKAAAKVALGLVYGLEADAGGYTEPEP
jgi:hypothetical protein